jgi:hypothetical protein
MTIWKRWIQRGVLCGLLLGGLVAFATTASAADRMPAITDHAGMATWYEKEAATNREKAKQMEQAAQGYANNPALAHGGEGVAGSKINMAQHCQALVGSYTKAAEDADALSRAHRSMMK